MRNNLTLPVLMVVAALVLIMMWVAQRSAEPDPELATGDTIQRSVPVEPPTPAVSRQDPVVADAAPVAAAPPAPSQRRPAGPAARPAAGPSERGLVELVKEWAAAWSEQRVDDYLGCYARGFVPEGGLGRRQWEAQRRERISAPRFVRVAITGLEIELLDIGTGRATFLQHYRSDGYTDTVRKALDLVWEDGRWRIESESSTGTI